MNYIYNFATIVMNSLIVYFYHNYFEIK